MSKAIIVIGNGLQHLEATKPSFEYFENHLGVKTKRIEAAYLTPLVLEERLRAALSECEGEPVVIHYSGHGGKEGWGFNDGDIFRYDKLAGICNKHPSEILLINDCCHSGSAANYFEKAGLPQDRVSLIASTAADKEGGHGIADSVFWAWRERNNFEPPPQKTVATSEDSSKVSSKKKRALKMYFVDRVGVLRSWLKRMLLLPGFERKNKIHRRYYMEAVENWWQSRLSRVLHMLTFGRYPIVNMRIRLIFSSFDYIVVREIHPEEHYLFDGAMRWGARLDHYFFPKV